MRTRSLGLVISTALVLGPPAHSAQAGGDAIAWQEHFDRLPTDWSDPSGDRQSRLPRGYSIGRDGDMTFLHAHHDGSVDDPPPATHFGKAFATPVPLDRVRWLRWRWRVTRHPTLAPSDDAWLDAAASVYVIIHQPTIVSNGRGFKFAWLARSGAAGSRQRGLLQIELKHDAATHEWKDERVDLCALYRRAYGPCEGQSVLYVGVMTDADGTKSTAEADYGGFELIAAPE